MFDDPRLQVRLPPPRGKGVFRERARRLQNGYSRQCPTCEVPAVRRRSTSQEQTIRRAMKGSLAARSARPCARRKPSRACQKETRRSR